MNPSRLWWWSVVLYRRGWVLPAMVLKLVNYLAFRAVLPYEADLAGPVTLYHRGLGVVVHPNTKIGTGCTMAHGVTVAAGSNDLRSPNRVTLGDGVYLSVGCVIACPWDHALTVGDHASVGPAVVITHDLPAYQAAYPARPFIKENPRFPAPR